MKHCRLIRMTLKAVAHCVRKAIEAANEFEKNNELMENSYNLSGKRRNKMEEKKCSGQYEAMGEYVRDVFPTNSVKPIVQDPPMLTKYVQDKGPV